MHVINNSKNTPPKCIIQKKKKKNHQSKIELQERINNRERERERENNHLFFERECEKNNKII